MTYQEQIRRDKLRKKAVAAYYSFNSATHTGQRKKAIKQWWDVNARLEQLIDKVTRREDNAN
jgi:hypothetical protein